MNEIDRRLAALIEAPGAPSVDELHARIESRRRRRHRAAGALATIGLVLGASVVWMARPEDQAALTEVETTEPTTTATTGPDDVPVSSSIRHPVLEIEGCTPTRPATDPDAPRALYTTTDQLAVQIVAVDGAVPDAFAVLVRWPAPESGLGVHGLVEGGGSSQITLDVGDGTLLTVRSRGLDAVTVEDLTHGLVPRPLDAAVPGADLPDGSPFEIVAEDAGLPRPDGATSSCVMDDTTGAQIHASVYAGPLTTALATSLDWGWPTYIRLQPDGTVLVLSGPPQIVEPSMIDDVVDVTIDEWNELPPTPCTTCRPPGE